MRGDRGSSSWLMMTMANVKKGNIGERRRMRRSFLLVPFVSFGAVGGTDWCFGCCRVLEVILVDDLDVPDSRLGC